MKKKKNNAVSRQLLKRRRKRQNRHGQPAQSSYEMLETRQVLAAFFPAYIDGVLTLGDPNGAAPYDLADTFKLESLPGADKVIYLDADGHHSQNNAWNHDIEFDAFDRNNDPSTFSDAELIELQKQFQNAAEDFLPFNINVTFKDPGIEYLTKEDADDTTYGIRVVMTQAKDGFGGFGGVAFLNSFDDQVDNPCFVLNKGTAVGGMTISHEVGHTLGLRHDGLNGSAYHPGVGAGETSWGPIMGAPFSSNVVQFSPGDYVGADNTEDDFGVITKAANGFDFRPDDYGSTLATAADLAVDGSVDTDNVFQWGIIEQQDDVDVFQFQTGTGNVKFDINPLQESPNLDIQATLFDEDGNVVAVSQPTASLDASFDLMLNSGKYYLEIDGVGLNGRYPEYGSIGFYSIEGTVISVGGSPIGETGTIPNLNHIWQTIDLTRDYVNPIVIAGPATRIGGDPVTVRVNNVTSSSFDIQLDEWDYRDGRHIPESVGYMVFEAGEYELLDGTLLKAGTQTASSRWTTFDTSESSFTSAPLVFSQVTTTNGHESVTTRMRNPNHNGFQIRIQEQQANTPQSHTIEDVAYVAVTPGSGALPSFIFEAGTVDGVTHQNKAFSFAEDFTSTPVLLSAMQSYNGGDAATVRLRGELLDADGATIFLEEERSADNEVRHIAETVGYFAISAGEVFGDETGGDLPDFIIAHSDTVVPEFAGRPAYKRTDTADHWAALAEMESWGDEIVGDLSDDEHHHEHDHDHSTILDLGNRFVATGDLSDLETVSHSETGGTWAIGEQFTQCVLVGNTATDSSTADDAQVEALLDASDPMAIEDIEFDSWVV